MTINLFGYQQEDVTKLVNKKSCLIGNDPGTGKTYEGIALDLERRKKHEHTDDRGTGLKTLIICPKSVLSVWDDHCMDLTDLDVFVIDSKNRKKFVKDCQDPRKWGYFICHWDALRLMPELRDVKWFHIIGDEIHRAKNRKAQVTRALKRLKTVYKTGMSGTPADNKPQDLWSILNWLWPTYYTSYWNFVKAYIKTEQTPEGYSKFIGVKEENIPHLRKEMEPWYTRRLKEDVLKDLPDKYYTRIWVDLTPKQRKAYDQMRKTMIAWVEDYKEELERNDPIIAQAAVSQLVRLQQFANAYVVPQLDENGQHAFKWNWSPAYEKSWSLAEKRAFRLEHETDPEAVGAVKNYLYQVIDPSSKLDALMDILRDREGEQVVIFSQFRSVIELLEQRLVSEQIPYGVLTGSVSQEDRAKNVSEFQSGRLRVFVGTIAAGGVGLTLTAARTVVFIDRSWSPAINRQAEDRLHRIGQKDAVEVIDLMARNTVDLGKAAQLSLKWKWLQMLLDDKVDPEIVLADLQAEMNSLDLQNVLEESV